MTILSVFQLIQRIPYEYFEKTGIQFDAVYTDLIKKLCNTLSLGEYQCVRIIIDARHHKGGRLGEKKFQENIEDFLQTEFPKTVCSFRPTSSNKDILLELADFISNTFYKEYQKDSKNIFNELGFRLVQIENPLS